DADEAADQIVSAAPVVFERAHQRGIDRRTDFLGILVAAEVGDRPADAGETVVEAHSAGAICLCRERCDDVSRRRVALVGNGAVGGKIGAQYSVVAVHGDTPRIDRRTVEGECDLAYDLSEPRSFPRV